MARKPVALASTGAQQEMNINDKYGQVLDFRYFNSKGLPVNSLDVGYHQQLFEYDSAGNITRRRFYNSLGLPVADKIYRSHDHRTIYDRFGGILSESYFDANNQKVNNKYGYHKVQSTYNDFGRVIEQSWLNAKGEPVRGPEGVFIVRYEYDNRGLQVGKRNFFAPLIKPLADRLGIAEVRYAYNSKQQPLKEQFFGLQGQAVEDSEGNHLILKDYDDNGREVRVTKKRKDGRPNLIPASGIATHLKFFDIDGELAQHVYANDSGNVVFWYPVFTKGAVTHIAFNDLQCFAKRVTNRSSGSLTAEDSYYDSNGKLTNGPLGYAEVKRLRSKNGQILQEVFYGPGGLPSEGPQGFHRMLKSGPKSKSLYYDRQNNLLSSFNSQRLDSGNYVDLIYIHEVFSTQNIAAQSGLRAGDVLWRYGGWSYPKSRKALLSAGRDPDVLLIYNELSAELDRRAGGATEATILRDGRLKRLAIPPLPERRLGVNLRDRVLPINLLSQWGVSLD